MEVVSHITRRSHRVRRAIAKDQNRRVTVVGWIQLLFASHMLVTSLVTAQAAGTAVASRTVVLLVMYAGFAGYTLFKSRRTGMDWYEIAASIALDFGLVMEIMFFQHGALDGGNGMLGGAPMFTYVYLLVAMRVLHFRYQYVVAAGVLAAACWATLVAITVSGSGGNWRALGIEAVMLSGMVDKLFSIVFMTTVVALAAREARAYFESSIVRGVAGNKLAKLVSSEVADQVLLAGGLRPGQGRIEHAAILMMDIRNFSRFATAMAPDQVLSLLQEYQALMVPVIAQRSGVVDKFMGDGILAHFGAVKKSESAAMDALKTIEDLMYATERWNEERRAKGQPVLEFGAAVSVGAVIFGALGGGAGKTEYTIIGHAVNVAAKLEKHTKHLGVRALCTKAAFDEAAKQGFKGQYNATPLAGTQIAGLEHAIDVVILCEKAGKSSAPTPPAAPSRSPVRLPPPPVPKAS